MPNPPAPLIDTHCHLDLQQFDADRDDVIARAVEAGVKCIIVPAVDLASNAAVIQLADRYSAVRAAVGIHPNDIPPDRSLNEAVRYLREIAGHPRVVAIGEIGLDYYWNKTPVEIQRTWLNSQLELAAELGLPVILHNREATSDLMGIIERWVSGGLPDTLRDRSGVLHSFSAGLEDARAVIEHGFYVGFTGPLTYKKADQMRAVALDTSLDRILVETDAPFLAPHPHRGERNEPAFVRYVVQKLAEIRAIGVGEMAEQTTRNAARLFAFPEE